MGWESAGWIDHVSDKTLARGRGVSNHDKRNIISFCCHIKSGCKSHSDSERTGSFFFHKVVDSCSVYKNYDLPPPSTIVRNTSSTSNYPIHTFWHGPFKCNPFPFCQSERGFQQCYFPVHVHYQGCSLNKPTNPWHIIIVCWVLQLLHYLHQLL